MRCLFLITILFLYCHKVCSQEVKGKVIDIDSKKPIPYVHIGFKGKSIGTISNEEGFFKLKWNDGDDVDTLSFSIIGYQNKEIVLTEKNAEVLLVKLQEANYDLKEVVVKQKKMIKKNAPEKKIGRKKERSNYTGGSGLGWGGEMGIKINAKNRIYKIKDINFNVSELHFDSVLFRVNIYTIKNGLPDRSILLEEIFMKGYYQESWITKNVESENLFIEENVIVTLEPIRGWTDSGREKSFGIFYSNGLFYRSKTYMKESSMADWKIIDDPKLTLFLTVDKYRKTK